MEEKQINTLLTEASELILKHAPRERKKKKKTGVDPSREQDEEDGVLPDDDPSGL